VIYTSGMFRRAVVSLLLLWLPLQGLAAVSMPFCRHALDSGIGLTAQKDAHAGHAQHAHEPHAPAHGSDTSDHAGGMACNDCGACHLACAAMMLSEPIASALRVPAAKVSVPSPLAPPALVLDQPNPPPLACG
jgi:hypothetical protein